jgi:hypothetical protein
MDDVHGTVLFCISDAAPDETAINAKSAAGDAPAAPLMINYVSEFANMDWARDYRAPAPHARMEWFNVADPVK